LAVKSWLPDVDFEGTPDLVLVADDFDCFAIVVVPQEPRTIDPISISNANNLLDTIRILSATLLEHSRRETFETTEPTRRKLTCTRSNLHLILGWQRLDGARRVHDDTGSSRYGNLATNRVAEAGDRCDGAEPVIAGDGFDIVDSAEASSGGSEESSGWHRLSRSRTD
jgi:hypothetical protein